MTVKELVCALVEDGRLDEEVVAFVGDKWSAPPFEGKHIDGVMIGHDGDTKVFLRIDMNSVG